METIRVENFELPDGSIYSGECIKINSLIELKGQGQILYPNGDKYIGEFDGGNVRGYGKYLFSDGDIHYGHFYDGIPNGIGYLNKHYSMCMGNFSNGLLNGWALRINNYDNFGWWEEGTLIKDEVTNIEWVFEMIRTVKFNKSLAPIFKNGMFGFGVHKNIPNRFFYYYGILFLIDGGVFVGQIIDYKKTGYCVFYKSNGEIEYAKYLCDEIIEESNSELVRINNIHFTNPLIYFQ